MLPLIYSTFILAVNVVDAIFSLGRILFVGGVVDFIESRFESFGEKNLLLRRIFSSRGK